jgi:V/A-type H+-transporting ATPase subunit E
MEKISEAVIGKVKLEAQNVVKEAEQKAKEEVDKAKKQRQVRFEQEKARMLAEAKEEADRILAQASIKARQRLASAKADAIARITDSARRELSRIPIEEDYFLSLASEAMAGLGGNKGRIYVARKDVNAAKKFLEADKELSGKISEVREFDCLGGVIAEDSQGKLRIDNTYETRLEMVLPKLLPKVSEELFKAP